MNKTILKQAFLFKDENPIFSKVKELSQLALKYQSENEIYFLHAKRGEKAVVKNQELFFRFLFQTQQVSINNFEDISNILNAETRSDNIKFSGDSKSNFIRVFDNVVVVKKKGEIAKLYQSYDLNELEIIENFLAIENGETFLNIEKFSEYFNEDYFIYLAGYANTLTRTFLKTKKVTFFVDFDIEGLNIYESFECESKKLHIPKNIEKYFLNEKYNNVELYKKQRARMKSNYSQDVMPIIELIKEYNTVVEQEIVYETH
jgi:hypothetical protein